MSQSSNNTALVIGVHKEELAFGKKVVTLMAESDIHIVQIDNGLSHERSYYRSGFYHSTAHREMYLQLHQQLVGNKVDLVIDLHTGINETGRCADIMSANLDLLNKMHLLFEGVEKHTFSEPGEERLYKIIKSDERSKQKDGSFSVCHTIIPHKVWDAREYIYTGLEIYLHETGNGFLPDWEYTVGLIRMLKSTSNNKDT